MKTETKNIVNNDDLKNLLQETHETLAKEFAKEGKSKNFSVVDLWNMEKTHRSAFSQRRCN
jgi:hypothetical protein